MPPAQDPPDSIITETGAEVQRLQEAKSSGAGCGSNLTHTLPREWAIPVITPLLLAFTTPLTPFHCEHAHTGECNCGRNSIRHNTRITGPHTGNRAIHEHQRICGEFIRGEGRLAILNGGGQELLFCLFQRIQRVMTASSTARKPKLMAENRAMNRPACPLMCFVYSRKVMRLASDATSVPAPPMFTPTSSPG